MKRTHAYRGTTLVEVVVTVASISALAAILLPAMGSLRETATRAACSNNLARVSRALITHDTLQGRLPGWRNALVAVGPAASGAIGATSSPGALKLTESSVVMSAASCSPSGGKTKRAPSKPSRSSGGGSSGNDCGSGSSGSNAGCGGGSPGTASTPSAGAGPVSTPLVVSWSVKSLPYLGENEAHEWFDTFSPFRVADDATLKQIDIFLCPAAEGDVESVSPLCYFVNGGSAAESTDAQGRQYAGDGVFVDAAGNVRGQPWYVTAGGAKDYLPGRSAIVDVVEGDGSSMTLLMAERTGFGAPMDVSWADVPEPASANGNAVATAHTVLQPGGIHPGYGAPGGGQSLHATENTWMKIRGDTTVRYPSSRHEDGFVASFCDGHTRFMRNDLDQWVYCQVLSSNPRTMSYRVGMFEKVADPSGVVQRYMLSHGDLGAR